MKMNSSKGDLTDVSAKKEALVFDAVPEEYPKQQLTASAESIRVSDS